MLQVIHINVKAILSASCICHTGLLFSLTFMKQPGRMVYPIYLGWHCKAWNRFFNTVNCKI